MQHNDSLDNLAHPMGMLIVENLATSVHIWNGDTQNKAVRLKQPLITTPSQLILDL